MIKEKIKQRFFDEINEKINSYRTAEELKVLAEAFKILCEIDDNAEFLKQLAEIPATNKGVSIQPLSNDDSIGFCD